MSKKKDTEYDDNHLVELENFDDEDEKLVGLDEGDIPDDIAQHRPKTEEKKLSSEKEKIEGKGAITTLVNTAKSFEETIKDTKKRVGNKLDELRHPVQYVGDKEQRPQKPQKNEASKPATKQQQIPPDWLRLYNQRALPLGLAKVRNPSASEAKSYNKGFDKPTIDPKTGAMTFKFPNKAAADKFLKKLAANKNNNFLVLNEKKEVIQQAINGELTNRKEPFEKFNPPKPEGSKPGAVKLEAPQSSATIGDTKAKVLKTTETALPLSAEKTTTPTSPKPEAPKPNNPFSTTNN